MCFVGCFCWQSESAATSTSAAKSAQINHPAVKRRQLGSRKKEASLWMGSWPFRLYPYQTPPCYAIESLRILCRAPKSRCKCMPSWEWKCLAKKLESHGSWRQTIELGNHILLILRTQTISLSFFLFLSIFTATASENRKFFGNSWMPENGALWSTLAETLLRLPFPPFAGSAGFGGQAIKWWVHRKKMWSIHHYYCL